MDQNQTSRPIKVRIAVKLFYIMLGIGVFRTLMEPSMQLQRIPVVFILFLGVVIMLLFIWEIEKGRNWARITFVVGFTIAIPFSILLLVESLFDDIQKLNPIMVLLGIAQIVIQIIVLILLLQKTSSDWFRETKEKKSDT